MAASSGDAAAKLKKHKRVEAKIPFKTPHLQTKLPHPEPPWDSEETAYRVEAHSVRPGPVPQRLRQAASVAGLDYRPELPDRFKHAVHKGGRPLAGRMMKSATQALVKKGVRFGSGGYDLEEDAVDADAEEKELKIRLYTDQELRQAFGVFDLNANDYIDAAELRHIFAQIGEMPSDNEISAMILLCDPRGEGTVNFDDFLNVFANPSDALRNANVKGIRHLLPRKKIDLDIRDALGITLEEKVRLKEVSLVVSDVRKGGQAAEAGVKTGWQVISVEGEPVLSQKDFEAKILKLENQAKPDDEEDGLAGKKGGKKGRGRGAADEPAVKKQIKWDYNIIFAVLPGMGDSSSSEELFEEENEEEAAEEDEEDED